MPTLDEAISFALMLLREQGAPSTPQTRDRIHSAGSSYGYDIYAPTAARRWAAAEFPNSPQSDRAAQEMSAVFYEALWELCRRGILRPGVRATLQQGVNDGGGYCLTAYGRDWLREATDDQFVMMQPSALAAAFARFRIRFGEGYHQRTQEAIRCRNTEAWLATCTMIGAAAESILLALAVAKTGDEDGVLRSYTGRDGRKAVMNTLIGQAPPGVARPLTSGMALLSYWRDTAGHGQIASIAAPEADQALRELLSLSQFAEDNWDDIVSSLQPPRRAAAASAA
jgi:hypothetical protein